MTWIIRHTMVISYDTGVLKYMRIKGCIPPGVELDHNTLCQVMMFSQVDLD